MMTAATIRLSREKVGGVFVLEAEQFLSRPVEELFPYFSSCHHMNDVLPGWLRFRVVRETPGPMTAGASYEYVIRWRGIGLRWRTHVTECDAPRRFVDVQEHGPYRFFEHEHTFTPTAGGTMTRDVVRYLPPGGPLAGLINRLRVGRDLRLLFEHRHRRMWERFGGVRVQDEVRSQEAAR
jgi:ligand-binding SRPBCC domain-containing protein